ncbi:unnamed protein product, partial [Staurois parvus]
MRSQYVPIDSCLHRHTLPCATFQVSSHCWCFPIFCHRVLADYGPPIAASQAPNLPWAPIPPPHACCQVQSPLMGPCTASILDCCCLHRHTLPMCHFQVSITLLVYSIF